jgi:hypothetical protein
MHITLLIEQSRISGFIKAACVNSLAAAITDEQLQIGILRHMIVATLDTAVDVLLFGPLAKDVSACMIQANCLLVHDVAGKVERHRVLDDAVKITFDLYNVHCVSQQQKYDDHTR